MWVLVQQAKQKMFWGEGFINCARIELCQRVILREVNLNPSSTPLESAALLICSDDTRLCLHYGLQP